MMKRFFDVCVSIVVLTVCSPILLGAAIGIQATSKGPLIYRAKRVGIRRKTFDMYKFRTMHINNGGAVITAKDDPRIFGFGKFLRKSKIDELPQFVNVLMGQMSIVGPRPEDPKIVDESYTDWMMGTLDVKPGITSVGAVYYYVSMEKSVDDIDPERFYVERILPVKLAVDVTYLEVANFWRDLTVIFHTALAIIFAIFNKNAPKPNKILRMAKTKFPEMVFQE